MQLVQAHEKQLSVMSFPCLWQPNGLTCTIKGSLLGRGGGGRTELTVLSIGCQQLSSQHMCLTSSQPTLLYCAGQVYSLEIHNKFGAFFDAVSLKGFQKVPYTSYKLKYNFLEPTFPLSLYLSLSLSPSHCHQSMLGIAQQHASGQASHLHQHQRPTSKERKTAAEG